MDVFAGRAREAPSERHRGRVLGRPALAEKYVPPLVDELEMEFLQRPDPEGEQILGEKEAEPGVHPRGSLDGVARPPPPTGFHTSRAAKA